MTRFFAVLLAVLVSACGSSKLDGTYSSNMTGVAEQEVSFTFKPDGTAIMSIGSTTLPGESSYEMSGSKIKVAGVKGDLIFSILENGDLVGEGLRLKKKSGSSPQSPTESKVSTARPVEQAAQGSVPAPTSAPAPVTERVPTSSQVSWSPSFDCAKATTFSENAICTDTLLGKLDGALAGNYRHMLASNIGDGAISDLKTTQKKWLTERNKCTDNQCLVGSYKKRIDEVCDYPVLSGVHPLCVSADEVK